MVSIGPEPNRGSYPFRRADVTGREIPHPGASFSLSAPHASLGPVL